MFEAYLQAKGHFSADDLSRMEAEVSAEVEAAAEEALQSRTSHPVRPETVLDGVYAP
jgi:TPP-dependent pyruvate/acetoin dehydrogenase alpha subunit